MIRVTFRNGKFLGKCLFEERKIFKDARWDFDRASGIYFTNSSVRAKLLSPYMDGKAKIELGKNIILTDLWENRPEQILVPQGLSLKPHQPIAVTYGLRQNKGYQGLDPGLGKTIVAATIAHNIGERIIYICPPFLVQNTIDEFKLWAPNLRVIALKDCNDPKWYDVLVIPDSMVHKEDVRDLIMRHCSFGKATLFIDEAHRFKNDETRRTKSVLGQAKGRRGRTKGIIEFDNIHRIVPMSGTPMPNRPMELYGILDRLAPETIDYMTKFDFGKKFCGGKHNGFGWNFDGHSNMKELRERVQPKFMLRMRKSEWLKDLPPKIEEIVMLTGKTSVKLAKMTSSLLEKHSPEDLMKQVIANREGMAEGELHIATYRRLLGVEKLPLVKEYVKNLLEETEEKLLIFVIHKEVASEIAKELSSYNPLVITGDTKMETRHALVREFQTDENRRVIIGNIQAMGVGFTLTKANRVLFIEWSWVPGENDQAGDRVHRITLEHACLVQFLAMPNSLDRPVLETLLYKRSATKHI